MTDTQNLAKLIGKLQRLVDQLENLTGLPVHQNINQSYYMQKVAELQMLHDRLTEIIEKEKTTCDLISKITPGIIESWKRDVRWLQKYSVK
jgi:hypothetical protein